MKKKKVKIKMIELDKETLDLAKLNHEVDLMDTEINECKKSLTNLTLLVINLEKQLKNN